MQRQKFYNLQGKSCFYCVLFVFKKQQNFADELLQWQKLIVQSFAFFRKQKFHNYNTLYCVDCRAFHAASCGIFCFLNQAYQVVGK